MQHLDDVIDVIIEIETALGQWNHPCIGPVGDVHLMGRQEGLDRSAQQRRIMAGHRGNDQQPGLRYAQRARQLAIEVQHAAERLFPYHPDFDRGANAADFGVGNTPFRFAVAPRGALEQFAGRRNGFTEFGVRPRIERILKQDLGGVRDGARRIERRLRHFVHPVHRRGKCRTAFGHQRRCAPKLTNWHYSLEPLLHRSIVPNA